MRLTRVRCVLFAFLLPLGVALAQTPSSSSSSDRMPVTRVVLFKNGVGYFEHQGRVRNNEDVAISFSSGQLNDVLKSLTVLDLNGGQITGVSYGSDTPLDRQLGSLRLAVGEKTTLGEFLNALRGAKVELRAGPGVVATGRLLSVERKTRIAGGTTQEVESVSLISDTGEMRSVELSPQVSVRLLEKGLTGKVDQFLDLISKTREPDLRRMVVSTSGTGERSLFVSYVSEAPVWKTTYRIVLTNQTEKKPLLQGWAIVDNTVGQDWVNVSLSLVAGAPQSFIQELSQPFYARRPVVPLPSSFNMTPQTHESTLALGLAQIAGVVSDQTGGVVANATVRAINSNNETVGETHTDAAGNYRFQSLPDGPLRLEIESPGFQRQVVNGLVASTTNPQQRNAVLQVGSVSQSVEVAASAPMMNAESSSISRAGRSVGSGAALGSQRLEQFAKMQRPPGAGIGSGSGGGVGGGIYTPSSARSSLQAAALAQSLGDAFEYKLKQPITIKRNQSALVPIAQTSIDAEKVSIWNDSAGLPLPQRALWLNNTSGLTLDGGSFTVLEEETFAGEGIFDPIRPAEKRLVTYATDLALTASSNYDTKSQAVTKVKISHGVLTQTRELQEKKTYTFRNQDTKPRTVIIEHPVRPGYELRGSAKPVETSASLLRFRLTVDPKQTASLPVEEARPLDATYTITNISPDQIVIFVRERSINPQIEAALRSVNTQKVAVAALQEKVEANEAETQKIFDDQQRLRENMKALKGSAEEKALLQRYTQQLNEQENRLEALRRDSTQLEAQRQKAQAALDAYVDGLSFDVSL